MQINITEPISADRPCGINPREDEALRVEYYAVKDLRHQARAIERGAVQSSDMKQAKQEWNTIYQQCIALLTKQTKDIEVLAWLIEAALRKAGFVGLSAAFNAAADLIDQYWESLYPEEEDLEDKLAALVGLNGIDADGTLIVPISMVLLTNNTQDNYAFWQYQQVLELTKITDPKKLERKLSQGVVSMEEIIHAVQATDVNFYHKLILDLTDCIAAFNQFTRVLDQKFNAASPPSSRIIAVLTHCQELLGYLLKESGITLEQEVNHNEAPAQGKIDSIITINNTHHQDLPNSREEALSMILRAADFFTVYEPQSIIPSVLHRAVRWAKMPLTGLLQEIITDSGAVEHLANTTGIYIETKQ